MIKPLTLAVTIIFALSSSGCVTAVVWSDACTTTISRPQVRQIDPPANGQPARAVVNYSVSACDNRFGFDRTLPLGPDGLPPAPFVYQGKLLTLAEIANDIPIPQKQAILAAKLTPIDRPATTITSHSLSQTQPAKVMRNWSLTYHASCLDEIGIVILSPDPSRAWPQPNRYGNDPDLATVRVMPGEAVVFIPLSQPRPAGDLARARIGATILTPPAVAADAALLGVGVPLIFIMLMTGAMPRC